MPFLTQNLIKLDQPMSKCRQTAPSTGLGLPKASVWLSFSH